MFGLYQKHATQRFSNFCTIPLLFLELSGAVITTRIGRGETDQKMLTMSMLLSSTSTFQARLLPKLSTRIFGSCFALLRALPHPLHRPSPSRSRGG
ncbi:hypothetical protein LINPERHAP1_LOCUS8436 [Linum perenne]